MLEYIYTTFIYNILLLLNILFVYNTLLNYTSKHVLSITGSIILSVLNRHDEHLQDFECPFAVWEVMSEDRLSSLRQDGFVLFTTK